MVLLTSKSQRQKKLPRNKAKRTASLLEALFCKISMATIARINEVIVAIAFYLLVSTLYYDNYHIQQESYSSTNLALSPLHFQRK